MTLPPDPTPFLAHCKAHKSQTQNQPCKELKMPAHNPPTPADGILLGLTTKHQANLVVNILSPILYSTSCIDCI